MERRDAQALVRRGELARIDHAIVRMWQIHRHWTRTGDKTNGNDPVEVLKAIDDLLDQRHQLLNAHGELIAPADRADATEWGPAHLGGSDATPA